MANAAAAAVLIVPDIRSGRMAKPPHPPPPIKRAQREASAPFHSKGLEARTRRAGVAAPSCSTTGRLRGLISTLRNLMTPLSFTTPAPYCRAMAGSLELVVFQALHGRLAVEDDGELRPLGGNS